MVIQTFSGTVVEQKMLTADVLFLSLAIPETFSFNAGQFVTIKITQSGVTRLKSYSIFNPPTPRGKLDFCIKIIDGGFASEEFKRTKRGDSFELKGPFGHFLFDEKNTSSEYWFLGAGTGVAPLYSMLAEYVPKLPQQKFVLLFGVREQKNLFYDDILKMLAKKNPNFTYVPILSCAQWSGKQGHVQDHLPEDVSGKMFYVCGLKELVLETKELLVQKGVALDRIKSERYD
ncbi:hypothetical protein J4210_02535 [Candidatus Woesearchaeota archaeon]|nr:hypothetical protein [Candidatus Woesearchaeota archaeon]